MITWLFAIYNILCWEINSFITNYNTVLWLILSRKGYIVLYSITCIVDIVFNIVAF